jgi:hypothetical protein
VALSLADFDLPERDPAFLPSVGLATFLNANSVDRRFIVKCLQAPSIVNGIGIASDAQHTSNRALDVLGEYTFSHLPTPSFSRSAGRDSLTLNSVFSQFLKFPFLPGTWYPIEILSFMRAVEDNAALAECNPEAYNLFVPLMPWAMVPAPLFLSRFLSAWLRQKSCQGL